MWERCFSPVFTRAWRSWGLANLERRRRRINAGRLSSHSRCMPGRRRSWRSLAALKAKATLGKAWPSRCTVAGGWLGRKGGSASKSGSFSPRFGGGRGGVDGFVGGEDGRGGGRGACREG